jgi:hypothetical protein
VLPSLLKASEYLKSTYSNPIYGTKEIPSLNFSNQPWIKFDDSGEVLDPYVLLGERTADPELLGLELLEENEDVVADGGAAMVAYGLLQSGLLDLGEQANVRRQLLRYCELDTLAMIFVWEAINKEILGRANTA